MQLILVQLIGIHVVSSNSPQALKIIPNQSSLATNLRNQVPDLLPFILSHHPLEAAVIARHVNAELFVAHLSLHGAPLLHASVLDLSAQDVSGTSILVAVLLSRKVGPSKCLVDSAVKVAAGIVISHSPQLAWVQGEV